MNCAAGAGAGGVEIDFVDENPSTARTSHGADGGKFLVVGKNPARIVQVGEDDKPRRFRQRGIDRRWIEAEIVLRPTFKTSHLGPDEADGSQKWFVGRIFDQN